ncbi:MAG: preprotein translocase subunit YajC, partial [Oligoflexales bacterium]|nr:preprotein translocase subunit YajC [Oligoflexales bacterium]
MLRLFLSDIAYAAGETQTPSMVEMLILPLGFLFIMYFLIIRPQQKKQKEHQDLLGNLKAGDEVITSGGIIGRIKSVTEGFINLEISSNTCIKITRQSV